MMEREQCSVRCHLRGFDTGFFCRNRLYRRSYNEKNERADAERQSEPERQHFDCAARDGKRIPRKRCRVRDRFAATGIFTAATPALRPENASLPTSRTSLPRNSRRRGNRNGGKVTDFRKAEIWLLGYPGILRSISQAERREVCSQGELSPTCGEDRVFYSLWRGFPENSFPYFLCWSCFLRKGNQVTIFSPAGKRLPDEEKELPAHWRRNGVSFRRLSKFLQDKPENTRYNGDTAREVICYEENPHRRYRHR